MSYINFSLTTRLADPAQTVKTLNAGFSREGGKPELVETGTVSKGVIPPLATKHEITPAVADAASGLLQAVQGAGWVQDIEVTNTLLLEPPTVTWTMRHGAGGSGYEGQLPTEIQAVLDAARALDTLVRPGA